MTTALPSVCQQPVCKVKWWTSKEKRGWTAVEPVCGINFSCIWFVDIRDCHFTGIDFPSGLQPETLKAKYEIAGLGVLRPLSDLHCALT